MFNEYERQIKQNKILMLLERWLDPDAYLDDMDRLDQLEQEAQHKLDQQEKHDD
jgi:hypothetical protein